MSRANISRKQRVCVLCRYWNGALGSLKIDVSYGGETFTYEREERHKCFKRGKGMETLATNTCPYFVPRYED